ncbi:hypothetical protein BgiBS90_005128 [Biomphalaria glabrata]|nr:hypothetical protein BgiBS90_005128 [Biomphalaria glabrata]
MRFLIYLILFYKLNVGIFLADIHACPESNSSSFGSDNIFVRKGDPLKLCCSLTIDACNGTNTSDPLILKPKRARENHQTPSVSNVQLDPCNAVFETNSSDFSDGGTYICYKNSLRYPPLMRADVFVLASPSKPKDISVKYFERNSSLTIHFNPGRPSKHWLEDGFEVKLQNKIFSSLICLDPCKSNRSVSNFCTCDYKLHEEVLQLSQNVTVSVFRPSLDLKITSSQSRISFYPYEHVCPNPVSHLSFANVSSSDATILFQPSEITKRNIRKMDYHKQPLGFKILLNNSEELKRRFSLKLEFKKTVYKFSDRINQNVAVIFQDLSPYTKYTASVFSFAGGGESESQVVHFTTNASVPLLPPEIHSFSFSRTPFPTGADNCLYVSWKPLAEELQGEENLRYLYQIIPAESVSHKRFFPENSSVNYINVRLSNDSHIVRIWSENKVGRSDNYSEIIIPEYQEDFVNFYVDLEKDIATVYVFLSENYQAEALAVHWCVSQKSELCKTQDICKGLLRTPHIKNLNGEKVLTFKVSLKASCKKLNYSKVKSVPYKDFEHEDDDTSETRTALAQIVSTEYRYSYSDIQDEVFEPCQGNEAEAEDKNIGAPKSFFVSLKQNDRWMGMTPASCYYHTTAKTVDIKVTQSYNKDRKTVLTIEQRCDTQSDSLTSQQFLIKKFEIYHPVNSSCASKGKLLMQIKNNFLVSATYEPPSGLLQVCIVAIGNYTQYSILYDIEIDEVISETDISMVIGVVVSVVVLVFLAIPCSIYYRKCRRSRRRFSDFKELRACEDTLGNTHSSELKPLSEPNYSKKDSDSDSGRSSCDEPLEPCIANKQSSEKPECGDSGLSQLDFVGKHDSKSERYSHHDSTDSGSNGNNTKNKSERMSFGVDSGRISSVEESDNLSSGSSSEGNSTSASSETSLTSDNGSNENMEDSSSSSRDPLNEGSNYAPGNFSFHPPSC